MCALVTGVQTCALPIWWRSGEDRGIGDTAGSDARCAPCRARRHHSQFASRETCCHQRHSRAPCLTRITRPKSLQGKRPSKARSAQHARADAHTASTRSEEHTSELQSLMRISYAVLCLKKKQQKTI